MTRMSHPFTTIWSDALKKAPNYPPHPPMSAFCHSEQVLHIPAGYQLPERSDTSGN